MMKAYVQKHQSTTTMELQAKFSKCNELDQLIESETKALELLRRFDGRFSDEIARREEFVSTLLLQQKDCT